MQLEIPMPESPMPELEKARREFAKAEGELPEMSIRQHRKLQVAEWKARYGIQTYHTPDMEEPWIAVSVPECAEKLKEYGVKQSELNIGDLFANYGRLIDDMQLDKTGATEYETVKALAARVAERKEMQPK